MLGQHPNGQLPILEEQHYSVTQQLRLKGIERRAKILSSTSAANRYLNQVARVAIVGFAPDSRDEVRKHFSDPSFDIWAINELYFEVDGLEARANAWFQLHGAEPPTERDPNHKQRLAQMKCPVYMWKKHPEIPNSVEYPHPEIIKHFDIFGEGMATDITYENDRQYFNNSISWLVALAIYQGYKEIYIYGVNMAQDQALHSEYQHQRPSVEFYLGWARGAGIKIYLSPQSDILLCGWQYGRDDSARLMAKLFKRDEELQHRMNQVRTDMNQFNSNAQAAANALNQFQGALENNRYMINLGPSGAHSKRGKVEKEKQED